MEQSITSTALELVVSKGSWHGARFLDVACSASGKGRNHCNVSSAISDGGATVWTLTDKSELFTDHSAHHTDEPFDPASCDSQNNVSVPHQPKKNTYKFDTSRGWTYSEEKGGCTLQLAYDPGATTSVDPDTYKPGKEMIRILERVVFRQPFDTTKDGNGEALFTYREVSAADYKVETVDGTLTATRRSTESDHNASAYNSPDVTITSASTYGTSAFRSRL